MHMLYDIMHSQETLESALQILTLYVACALTFQNLLTHYCYSSTEYSIVLVLYIKKERHIKQS